MRARCVTAALAVATAGSAAGSTGCKAPSEDAPAAEVAPPAPRRVDADPLAAFLDRDDAVGDLVRTARDLQAGERAPQPAIADAAPVRGDVPAGGADAATTDDTPAGSPAPPPNDRCVPAGAVGRVRADARTLRLCVDEDDDGRHDRCAEVDRRSGRVTLTPPTAAEAAYGHPADLYLSGHPDDDLADGDATLDRDGDRLEVCPPTRACLRLAPALYDDERLGVARVRADDAVLAVAITSDDEPRFEAWDLATGRRRVRAALPEIRDELTVRWVPGFAGEAFVLAAEAGDTGQVRGWIYDRDGRRPRPLAGGSTRIEGQYVALVDARTLVAVEAAPPDAPILEEGAAPTPPAHLVGQDLATGRVLHRFPLPGFSTGDDEMIPAGGKVAAWVHPVDDERLVVLLDFATRRKTAVRVPLCP